MSLIEDLGRGLRFAGGVVAGAGRKAADIAMQQPTVRRGVDTARARIEEARAQFEERFEEVERDLWAWINKVQAEAQRAQRQVERARTADEYYTLLGLKPGADIKQVKRAYRDKMRENHPDKFAHDPVAEAAAHDRAQQINDAYQQLTALLTGRESRRVP